MASGAIVPGASDTETMINYTVVGELLVNGGAAAGGLHAGDLQVNGPAIIQVECGPDPAVGNVCTSDAAGTFEIQGLLVVGSHKNPP
jgi:hypothetical protein